MFTSFLEPSYSLKDKILFYESTANLLEWWVTLLSSLKGFLERLPPGSFRDVVENTIFFIEWGDAMNVAMRKIPGFYGEKEIAIIESWEQTGLLATTFWAIARELRMQEDLRNKVYSALTYPFIIFFFLALALIVVMTYVIPQIMPIIAEMTTEIPFSTRSLIASSNFLRDNGLALIVVLVAMSLIFYGYTSTWRGALWLDKQKLMFPLFWRLYKNYMVVQVMDTFSLLMGSGVSILKSLKLTWSSSGNLMIAQMFERISSEIASGKKITESFKLADPYHKIFTSDILQMIESAEKTSTIDIVSRKIWEYYRREVDNALAIMVKFIEPAALLSAWVFVLWFAVAIFSAIMQVVAVAWA